MSTNGAINTLRSGKPSPGCVRTDTKEGTSRCWLSEPACTPSPALTHSKQLCRLRAKAPPALCPAPERWEDGRKQHTPWLPREGHRSSCILIIPQNCPPDFSSLQPGSSPSQFLSLQLRSFCHGLCSPLQRPHRCGPCPVSRHLARQSESPVGLLGITHTAHCIYLLLHLPPAVPAAPTELNPPCAAWGQPSTQKGCQRRASVLPPAPLPSPGAHGRDTRLAQLPGTAPCPG